MSLPWLVFPYSISPLGNDDPFIPWKMILLFSSKATHPHWFYRSCFPPPPTTALILIFSQWVVNKTVLVIHTQLTLISMRAAQRDAPGCISREMLLWKTAGINKDLLQFSLYSSVAPRDGWNAACGCPGLVRFTQNLLSTGFCVP